MAKKLPRLDPKKLFQQPKPGQAWTPTPQQLAIYQKFIETGHYEQIARENNATAAEVRAMVRAIDDWTATRIMNDVRAMRIRHTQQLEHLYAQCGISFELSKQDEVTTESGVGAQGPIDKTRRRGRAEGNHVWIQLQEEILATIRKIWAADKSRDADPDDAGPRVAGVSHKEAIRRQIEHLQNALKATPDDPEDQNGPEDE